MPYLVAFCKRDKTYLRVTSLLSGGSCRRERTGVTASETSSAVHRKGPQRKVCHTLLPPPAPRGVSR